MEGVASLEQERVLLEQENASLKAQIDWIIKLLTDHKNDPFAKWVLDKIQE